MYMADELQRLWHSLLENMIVVKYNLPNVFQKFLY